MLVSEFLDRINSKAPPAPALELRAFEATVGGALPSDYRSFLVECNGGHVGGALWFLGPTPAGAQADAGVNHIGGFRHESYFSLEEARCTYRGRIPQSLIWIMDDPFGNAICLGISGNERGKVYFWDHEMEPDDDWDGRLETAGNVQLIADSFTEFVAGLAPNDDETMEKEFA